MPIAPPGRSRLFTLLMSRISLFSLGQLSGCHSHTAVPPPKKFNWEVFQTNHVTECDFCPVCCVCGCQLRYIKYFQDQAIETEAWKSFLSLDARENTAN